MPLLESLRAVFMRRRTVDVAIGAIAAQEDLLAPEARAILEALARDQQRTVYEVAYEVVARLGGSGR